MTAPHHDEDDDDEKHDIQRHKIEQHDAVWRHIA
jgi:hypothetical protein